MGVEDSFFTPTREARGTSSSLSSSSIMGAMAVGGDPRARSLMKPRAGGQAESAGGAEKETEEANAYLLAATL